MGEPILSRPVGWRRYAALHHDTGSFPTRISWGGAAAMTSLRRNRDALMAAKRALLEDSAEPVLTAPAPSTRVDQLANDGGALARKPKPKVFTEYESVQATKLKQSVRRPARMCVRRWSNDTRAQQSQHSNRTRLDALRHHGDVGGRRGRRKRGARRRDPRWANRELQTRRRVLATTTD